MNKKFWSIGILSLSLMACASNQAASSSNQPITPLSQSESSSNMYNPATDADSATITNNNLNADHATNSVYFAVDQYSVDEQYAAVIDSNANYLASHVRQVLE